jgi:hypothetical protein
MKCWVQCSRSLRPVLLAFNVQNDVDALDAMSERTGVHPLPEAGSCNLLQDRGAPKEAVYSICFDDGTIACARTRPGTWGSHGMTPNCATSCCELALVRDVDHVVRGTGGPVR